MESYNIYRDQIVVYEFQLDLNFSDSLQSDNYITTTIESKNELDLRINDYILVDGVKYSIYKPIEMEESNGVYSYPVTFYAPYYRANFSILEDEGATTFPYHGSVSDFMLLIIQSLQKDYPDFTLGEIDEGGIIDLTFDNSNCLAAIQTICEAADMEFRFDGSVLNVKKRIGNETDYIFEYGKNKGGYSVKLSQVANASITTRMIGKGGSINLPKDYASPDSPKRLNLGNEILEKNVDKYGKITGVYINENIYPRLINKTVQAVEVPADPQTAASWKIKLDIPFNLADYYADNEIPLVKFQTGDLTGSEFEIVENSWNNTDKTLSIIVQDQDGYVLPNKDRQPHVGDVFVLLNIYMPKSYVDEATDELRKATQDELNRKSVPQYAPTLIADGRYIKKNNINLSIGDGITVKIGSHSLATRIIGITKSSSSNEINYDLGDQILYSYDTKTNNTLERIQTTLKQLINIDDIKRLFYNLINGWYPKWFDQKLHKDADVKFNSVEAKESVKTESVTANVISSEQFVSGPLGQGYRINKNGEAEFQNLTVRGTFSVFELLIQQIRAVGGQLLVSPASIKISLVEETDTGYKCSFNTENGTIPNPFVLNDQLIHQVFTGNSINRYWRLVTEIGVDYFVLSKDDCEAGSGTPAPDDEIMLLGNRTDKDRQSAILISAYGSDTPFVAYYAGINSFSLAGKEIMREGNLNGIVDKDFGRLQGFGVFMQNAYIKGILRLTSGKTVEEAVGDVQNNLDNLQVGETNLLDNSNKGWKNSNYLIADIYLGDYRPKEGEECTIVIKGKLGANKTDFGIYNSGGMVNMAWIVPSHFNADNIAKYTFKWKIAGSANKYISIYTIPSSVAVESEIEWVKLVLGNKTSLLWTPSINDQKEIAKQQGIAGGQEAVDKVQIGSQNLISKKMMLKWNEKNKDIAVWGQDSEGIYLGIIPRLLYENIAVDNTIQNPIFDIDFKENTQYVFSVEWKSSITETTKKNGLAIYIWYNDGTREYITLFNDITKKTRIDVVTGAGKTVEKISSSYGYGGINALIYNISLIEGNKPLQGFPVAEEDQTGANNVNLAEGTKNVNPAQGNADYRYAQMYMPKIKPNTIYYVNVQNIENVTGTPIEYTFVIYNKNIATKLSSSLNANKNGGVLITSNNFSEQDGYLLCYAGVAGSTAGNTVKFTEVMLVEGFLPAPVWTPSFSEQQAGIDAANSAAELAQQTAEIAQTTAAEATSKLNNWASDSLISPPEKSAMKQQQADIQAEYKEIKADVEKYNLTGNAAWTNYNSAYSLANSALTKYTASSPENITISSDYSNIAAYYPKRQEILNAISSAAKQAVDKAKQDAIDATIGPGIALKQDDDLDKLITVGTYTTVSSAIVRSLKNGPANEISRSGEARLLVESSGTYLKQTLTLTNSGNLINVFTRQRNSSGRFSAWITADGIRETIIDLTDPKYDQNKYYPVTISIPQTPETRIEIGSPLSSSYGKPSWSTHAGGFSLICAWRSNGSGWGSIPVKRTIEVFEYNFTTQKVTPAGSIGQLTNTSEELIYVRGGGRYDFRITNNCVAVVHEGSYTTAQGQTVAPVTSVTVPVPDLEALDYLKIALKEETTIEGGLISTSLIKVGAKQNGVNWNERAGICGIGDTDNSIRFYAGGDLDSAVRRVSGGDGIKANFVVTQAGRLFASDAIIEGNITVKNLTTASGKVVITEAGQLVASDANIQGTITATSGQIGGLIIDSHGLKTTDFNVTNQIGTIFSDDGFMVHARGNGVAVPSSGFLQAGRIVASGNNASITGLEIIAKSLDTTAFTQVTALKLETIEYYSGTMSYDPVALEVVRGRSLLKEVEIDGKSTFRNKIYLDLASIPNISGASNYYLCINRSTGQLSYR